MKISEKRKKARENIIGFRKIKTCWYTNRQFIKFSHMTRSYDLRDFLFFQFRCSYPIHMLAKHPASNELSSVSTMLASLLDRCTSTQFHNLYFPQKQSARTYDFHTDLPVTLCYIQQSTINVCINCKKNPV